MAALFGFRDLERAELGDSLVQRPYKRFSLQCIGGASGRHFAGVPIDDWHKIKEPAPRRQVRDVSHSNMVGPRDPQTAQQIGAGLVPPQGHSVVGLLVDRLQVHLRKHQSQRPPCREARARRRRFPLLQAFFVNHRRRNPEPVCQLGYRLFNPQGLRRHLRLEIRHLLGPFRHLLSSSRQRRTDKKSLFT